MRPQRILALTDLSPNSVAGLALADSLAHRIHAKVVVGYAHTRSDVLRDFSQGRESAERLAQWVREDDEEQLKGLSEKHIDRLRFVAADTVDAPTAREGVAELIRRAKPDLVCMATRGRTGVSHLLLGSVAEHTLRTAGLPVVVTKGGPWPATHEPLRVLVAHDLLTEPGTLAEAAAELLKPSDELVHAHVVESWYFSPSAYGAEFALPQPDVPKLVEAAQERLRRVTLPPHGPKTSVEVTTGRPGEGLLELEQKVTPHLIVARTHGRRGFDRMMLGSVSEFLARKAKAAVLILPKA
jgi:nucleotide-binding universal stress UspA family protein